MYYTRNLQIFKFKKSVIIVYIIILYYRQRKTETNIKLESHEKSECVSFSCTIVRSYINGLCLLIMHRVNLLDSVDLRMNNFRSFTVFCIRNSDPINKNRIVSSVAHNKIILPDLQLKTHLTFFMLKFQAYLINRKRHSHITWN